MSEEMRTQWTLSMPITAEYNYAMQNFCNLAHTTSGQHKEASDARVKRDHADQEQLHAKLSTHNPFAPDSSLRNIVTGVVATDVVNVHDF